MKDKVIKALKIKSPWTTIYLVDPVAIPLTLFFSNIKFIKPDAVTLSGLLVMAAASFFFARGYLLQGGFCFYIVLVIDKIDGKLARMNGLVSGHGRRLDSIVDKISKLVPLLSLLYGYFYRNDLFWLGIILIFGLHYGAHLFFHRLLQVKVSSAENTLAGMPVGERPPIFGLSRVESLMAPLDETFFILVLGPITGFVSEAIILASIIYSGVLIKKIVEGKK